MRTLFILLEQVYDYRECWECLVTVRISATLYHRTLALFALAFFIPEIAQRLSPSLCLYYSVLVYLLFVVVPTLSRSRCVCMLL